MQLKVKELIQKLISNTNEGKLQWEITSRENQYSLSMNTNQVIINYSNIYLVGPSETVREYEFCILDFMGQPVEKISERENLSSFSQSDDFEIMANLYETARRNAHNVDETIDSLLKELD